MKAQGKNVIWGCYQLTVTAGVALAECDILFLKASHSC